MARKSTTNYAIIRSEKRHNLTQLNRSEGHNSRKAPVPNADPSKPGPTLLLGGVGLSSLVRSKIPTKRRKDAVIAVETVLTASPEFFEKATPAQYKSWINSNLQWLKDRYGDNLVQVYLHSDEKSPHFHAYWVPITQDGRLSYKSIEGTRQHLVELQDSYAAAMAPYGLSRGKEHSQAKHSHHYQVAQRLDALETKIDSALQSLKDLAQHINTIAGAQAIRRTLDALTREPEGEQTTEPVSKEGPIHGRLPSSRAVLAPAYRPPTP